MKFISVNQLNELSITEGETPAISDNEVLVEVKAIGVNRADILQRYGKYPAPKGESDILGLEMSGIVTKVGNQVKQWQSGDAVFGLVPGGAYAQYTKLLASHLFSLPSGFTFEQGASLAEVFLTAYQSLCAIARVQTGDKVLIHAGASGVGTAAIQLAKAMECEVVVTVGNEHKEKACRQLGADHVINYQTQDFVEWTKENLPAGFDVIIDVVAGDYINKNIKVCALDGRIVILSMLGGRYAEHIDVAKLLQKRISIFASTLRNRSNDYKTELISNFNNRFSFSSGQLMPVIDTILPWQASNDAHQILMENRNVGKVVMTVE
ncbi:NAD(P)H-quinone oxidoreductase [Thalassotalea fusca]